MEGKLIVETMTENMGNNETYQKVTGPLMANSHPGSYTGQDAFSDMLVATEYIVRRLTPLECCRLQGFPDDWTDGVAIENPSASTIREWMIAWAEWWRIVGRDEGIQLPKDAKQVERWLADPVSDSGLYKMWGNGIALPCAMFVMEGIASVLKEENEQEEQANG
jgi:DNA (cytosine-5)-methyltransferase 1